MKKTITVIGSSNIDLITYAEKFPRTGETIRGRDFAQGYGGKGANQAVCAARLGASCRMITKLGDDLFGRTTIENYKKNNVNVDYAMITKTAPSGVATIIVDQSGDNSILIVPGANDLLSVSEVMKLENVISDSSLIICQNEISLNTTMASLKLARELGVFTVFNPAPAPLPDEVENPGALYGLCDVVIPNETELSVITSMPVNTMEGIEAASRKLLSWGPGAVVVTLGERGCLLASHDKEVCHIPVKDKIKPVDTTGAGDCFIGSFAYFLASGHPILHALQRSNIIAARSVLKPGTQASYPQRGDLPDSIFAV